jgi:hypothetical protein
VPKRTKRGEMVGLVGQRGGRPKVIQEKKKSLVGGKQFTLLK